MKAQLVKTFIKAAAIVALATSIANCGAMPEESITESTYQPTSENTDKTTNNDDEEETTNKTPSRSTEPVKDGCEAFGLVYDAANNTCVEDDTDTNIINPPVIEEPTIIVETCEGMGLVEENGTCVEPTIDPIEPTEVFNFTVTPAQYKVIATWDADQKVSSFLVEVTQEGKPYSNDRYPTGTSWTVSTYSCTSAYSFKLVANMVDGTTVESNPSPYLKPSNCE